MMIQRNAAKYYREYDLRIFVTQCDCSQNQMSHAITKMCECRVILNFRIKVYVEGLPSNKLISNEFQFPSSIIDWILK